MGHVFSAFGSRVSIVQRGDRMLTNADTDIATCFTEHAAERFDLRLQTIVIGLEPRGSGVTATIERENARDTVTADALLVATGGARTPTCSTSPPPDSRSTSTVTS